MDYIAIPIWKGGRVVGHAKVDPDFHWLRQWKWRATKNGYAMRAVSAAKHGRVIDNIWMHRIVTGCFSWLEVDHINRDRMDNRTSNLRMVTRAENMRNKSTYKNNSSGVPGVFFRKDKTINPWIVFFNVDGKRKHVGYFPTKEEAIAASNAARLAAGFTLTNASGNG